MRDGGFFEAENRSGSLPDEEDGVSRHKAPPPLPNFS